MAILKRRLQRKNASGGYDVVYLQTSSDLVLMSDGSTTLTSKISSIDSILARAFLCYGDNPTSFMRNQVARVINGDSRFPVNYCTYVAFRSSNSGSYTLHICSNGKRVWYQQTSDSNELTLSGWKELYGPYNKPTASDIGAANIEHNHDGTYFKNAGGILTGDIITGLTDGAHGRIGSFANSNDVCAFIDAENYSNNCGVRLQVYSKLNGPDNGFGVQVWKLVNGEFIYVGDVITSNQFNELKTSVSNGKSAVASAITDKGVSTSATATFDTMASNIRSIATGYTRIATNSIEQTMWSNTEFEPQWPSISECSISGNCITLKVQFQGRYVSQCVEATCKIYLQ